ncbi:hypothetical protein E2562_033185 [Oryza meyeriana var. granulata]|uniref:Uncharacterized protein n=1 Tax=Oryza meyeriana var. granulata TaxID=110450 RepID=A0A6G1DRL8_9ORYZ|nr:hypothetical protein E2562_033185 [Oryza meyeriana var. granulata]
MVAVSSVHSITVLLASGTESSKVMAMNLIESPEVQPMVRCGTSRPASQGCHTCTQGQIDEAEVEGVAAGEQVDAAAGQDAPREVSRKHGCWT